MYRVIEVAKMLGVSKVTIYKKINKNKKSLKPHVHTRSNITYIDDQGVEIIKDSIEIASAYSLNDDTDIAEIRRVCNQDLNEMISILNQQIEIKKHQIIKKDEIIESYKSIIKSNRGKIQYLEGKLNEL